MPTPWPEVAGTEPQIEINLTGVLKGIEADASSRETPTVAMAQRWHRDLYDGISRPHPYYAGEVRDSDPRFPDLIGYEVRVGRFDGVSSSDVPRQLAEFEQAAQAAANNLDAAIPYGTPAADLSPTELHGVVTYCAFLHGEWARIHPFANGNGRTARVWTHWAAIRYGLPPFLAIKPRPDQPYGSAAMASMTGEHQPTVALFAQLLHGTLRARFGSP